MSDAARSLAFDILCIFNFLGVIYSTVEIRLLKRKQG